MAPADFPSAGGGAGGVRVRGSPPTCLRRRGAGRSDPRDARPPVLPATASAADLMTSAVQAEGGVRRGGVAGAERGGDLGRIDEQANQPGLELRRVLPVALDDHATVVQASAAEDREPVVLVRQQRDRALAGAHGETVAE